MNTVQGARVRAARQAAQLTEEQLAEKADLSYGTIVAIEAGQQEDVSFEVADAIAKATDANIFKLYQPADGQPAYRGSRGIAMPPISGHDHERLTDEQQRQRELDGWSEREQEQAELAAIEEWDVHATPEARRERIDRIRRRNDLRQGLLGSPTGQRIADGAVPEQPKPPGEPVDYVWTSRGPQPVEPIGGAQ